MENVFIVIAILGVSAFMFYASYNIGSGVYVKAICRIPTDKKEVVLTFDDGVDARQTPLVLDVLRRNNAKACFFVIGEKAAENPDLVRRIVAEGHRIGIHTMRHQGTFPFGSSHQITADLRDTRELLENICGTKIDLFRPPFGVTNPHIGMAVRRLGLKTIGWSIRSYDTDKRRSRTDVAQRIERHLHKGAIILLHDDRTASDLLLEKIFEILNRHEYKVTTF